MFLPISLPCESIFKPTSYFRARSSKANQISSISLLQSTLFTLAIFFRIKIALGIFSWPDFNNQIGDSSIKNENKKLRAVKIHPMLAI